MRCKSCEKVHKHSQKGMTWKDFQLCPKCFKNPIVKEVLECLKMV